jgi:hypothetical protein
MSNADFPSLELRQKLKMKLLRQLWVPVENSNIKDFLAAHRLLERQYSCIHQPNKG